MSRQRPCRSTTVSSKMIHVLMNVMAMAILAISGKGGVVDFISSFFISVSFHLSFLNDLCLFEAGPDDESHTHNCFRITSALIFFLHAKFVFWVSVATLGVKV